MSRMSLFTRFRILNATRALVSEVGVERVTMRRIAALANITAPAIYKHFRNKRELLDRVIDSGYDELAGRMARGWRAPSPHGGLRVMTEAVVGFARDYPKLTLMMLAPLTKDEPAVEVLQPQIERCMRGKVLPWRNARVVAGMLWSAMRGLLSRRQEAAHLPEEFDDAMSAALVPLSAAA